jgi:hypothetical protein
VPGVRHQSCDPNIYHPKEESAMPPTPSLPHPTEDEIARLEARLQACLLGRVRDFRLRLAGQGVILGGRAPTYHAKQTAQQAFMSATRWPVLANEIEVSGVAGRAR